MHNHYYCFTTFRRWPGTCKRIWFVCRTPFVISSNVPPLLFVARRRRLDVCSAVPIYLCNMFLNIKREKTIYTSLNIYNEHNAISLVKVSITDL